MRSVLALCLLVALCASAAAAKLHHGKPRNVIARPSQNENARFPPVLRDQTPRYDDPSKFGGGCSCTAAQASAVGEQARPRSAAFAGLRFSLNRRGAACGL